MASGGEHSKDPCVGDCGVARRLIHVEGCPWVSGVPPPSVPPCPQQGQSKGQCPEFLLHNKAKSFRAHAICCRLGNCWTLVVTCSWGRDRVNGWGKCRGGEGEREREVDSLFPWVVFIWI